jgi:hypothetical protein
MRIPRWRTTCISWLMVLGAVPAAGAGLTITCEPESGPLSATFTLTLTNDTGAAITYDSCSAPEVVSLADGRSVFCKDVPDPTQCGKEILAPGASLTVAWSPLAKECPGTPPPAIYEVRWEGFTDARPARIDLTPDPDHDLLVTVDPPQARMGDSVRVSVQNTSGRTLSYNHCCFPPQVIDPRGRGALCIPCPLCVIMTDFVDGEVLTYDWTPGTRTCEGAGDLPGRYRVVWDGFLDGDSDNAQRYYGETTMLVLPPEKPRLELALSANEVPLGKSLGITATNPLDVSVWRAVCCDMPILIDALGRDSPCSGCPLDCAPSRSQEILPGGTASIEVTLPGGWGDCGLRPGRWSVVWGPSFALVPGGEPAPPVYGYAEFTVPSADGPRFVRGNCDGAGDLDLTDAVRLLGYLFLGDAAPPCLDACDADDSAQLDITDAVNVLGYLFLGGAAPAAPFPLAGTDPTPDALGCQG